VLTTGSLHETDMPWRGEQNYSRELNYSQPVAQPVLAANQNYSQPAPLRSLSPARNYVVANQAMPRTQMAPTLVPPGGVGIIDLFLCFLTPVPLLMVGSNLNHNTLPCLALLYAQ
jgi:hypothetical protein